ncbi:ankyrin repeat domain-containing protein [Paenibacillus sp. GYB003]|uniref:ankyrin repeat domain-containing protein n=1 Tax=Paenibacillus sp. GYB003 TaxID=2994392 RepID=UPI002F96E2B1
MESNSRIDELFAAAQSGDADKLKQLLEIEPGLANEENGQGLTPLGYAAHYGNRDAVRVLLEGGANVNAVSHSNVSYIPSNTALHAAIAGERSLDVVRLLLERGADTRLFDSNGHTCLHVAAFHDDNVELIRLLLEHGADANAAAGQGGETALSVAVRRGNDNVAAFLRERGASA